MLRASSSLENTVKPLGCSAPVRRAVFRSEKHRESLRIQWIMDNSSSRGKSRQISYYPRGDQKTSEKMRLVLDPFGWLVTFPTPLQKQGCKAPRGECGEQRKSKISNFRVDRFEPLTNLHAPPKKRESKEDAKAASAGFEE
ncbi:MAG: hypothetical protein JWL90_1757 [Chthoniobacteraceae bacterium]|nr:hypothetical protein [Chthoniobacteraceae bacterium]